MAQLTPRGYTVPDGTDPISAGDDLLRANFVQLDEEVTELYGRVQSGSAVVSAGPQAALVSYPGGPFASKPVTVVSIGDVGGSALSAKVNNAESTASAFAVLLYDKDGVVVPSGNYRINWIAFGEPS